MSVLRDRVELTNCQTIIGPISIPTQIKDGLKQHHQTIVGSLQYLAQVTRYEIAYAVNQLSRICRKTAIAHIGTAR